MGERSVFIYCSESNWSSISAKSGHGRPPAGTSPISRDRSRNSSFISGSKMVAAGTAATRHIESCPEVGNSKRASSSLVGVTYTSAPVDRLDWGQRSSKRANRCQHDRDPRFLFWPSCSRPVLAGLLFFSVLTRLLPPTNLIR